MKTIRFSRALGIGVLSLAYSFALSTTVGQSKEEIPGDTERYRLGKQSSDGIGKYYMGREISFVMGHRAAGWLERPERESEENPTLLIESLKLKPGQVVADIGAGTGYFSRRMAKAVGAEGLVYGVDIQAEMLAILKANMKENGISHFKAIRGSIEDPKLPANTIDLTLMVDVYHEFSHPYEMLDGICRALKPGGRVVFVEYRAEDPSVPIKRLHKMSETQVKKEASVQPLEWVETIRSLPRQHIIIFRKKGDNTKARQGE